MINWKILENPIFQTKPIDFFQFVKQNNMDPRKSSSSEPKCRPPRSRTHDHCVILGTFASSASALGVRSSALGVRSLILAGEQPCYWGHGSREWGHGKQQWGQMNSNDPTSEFSDDPVGLSGDTTCAISAFHSRNRSQMTNRIIHFAGTKKHGDIRRLQVARGCSMLFPKPPKPHLRAVSETGCHFWHIPAWKRTQIVRRGTIRQVSALGWPGAKLLGTVWQFQVFVICNRASPIAWSFSGLILSLNELQETSSVHDIEYTRCWT